MSDINAYTNILCTAYHMILYFPSGNAYVAIYTLYEHTVIIFFYALHNKLLYMSFRKVNLTIHTICNIGYMSTFLILKYDKSSSLDHLAACLCGPCRILYSTCSESKANEQIFQEFLVPLPVSYIPQLFIDVFASRKIYISVCH
jgi:hypothetical protein